MNMLLDYQIIVKTNYYYLIDSIAQFKIFYHFYIFMTHRFYIFFIHI
jgi:hypothetical protein